MWYHYRGQVTLFVSCFVALISGLVWYGQYSGYGTGATKMGQYGFASWSIFMAVIIIFDNLLELLLEEWKLIDSRARFCVWLGIVMPIISVMMIGGGDGPAQRHAAASAPASNSQ